MTDTDAKTLMIQVDASVELLRRNLASAEGSLGQLENRANQAGERVGRAMTRMGQSTNAASGQMRAGMQQLSFQMNDVAAQFAMGTKFSTIFAQQSGQVIQAVQVMTGGTSKLASFLGGPWGVALTTAAVVAAPFIGKLLEGTTAAEDNAKALDGVKLASSGAGDAQGVLGQMFDLTTGRIKDQNAMLRLNAQLMAVKLRADAAGKDASSARVFGDGSVGSSSLLNQIVKTVTFAPMSRDVNDHARAQALAQTVRQVQSGATSASAAIKWAEHFNFSGLRVSRADFIQAIADRASVTAQRRTADAIDSSLASGRLDPSFIQPDKKKKGPSAETLARQAEAARLKLLDEENAYTSAERQARHALLDATRKTTASEEARDALLREDINAEAAATKTRIANDLSAHKINDEQAAHLTDLAEQTRVQKLLNVDLARRSQIIRDAAALEAQDYDNQLALLQIQEGFATTVQQRRDIQRKLLEIETKKLLAAQQAVIDDPLSTTNQVLDAIGRQQQIRREQSARSATIANDNPMPLEEYSRRLHRNTDDMTEALQRVKVDGLGALEDGLVDAVSGTRSLGDAFKSMANQIIADLARIAIEKMIVGTIGGGLFGGGGLLGGLFGGFRAEGGPVTAGQAYVVGEKRPELFIPRTSGTILPQVPGSARLPRLGRAANDQGGPTVNFTINAPGATAETVAMIRRELANATPGIVAAATGNTVRQASRRRL